MGNSYEEEVEIDLKEVFFAIKRKILVILAVGLLCACVSCIYTKLFVSPIYTSSSTMLVLTKETTLASVADLQLGSQLTKDYSVLITSRPVLEDVIENLGLDTDYKELRECVTVTNPDDTRILQLSIENSDAAMAKAIVDELATVSSAYIGDKMEVVPPKIIDEGEIPTTRTSPDMKKIAILGLLVGFLVSGGIVTLMTVMNDTIKSEEDITKYLGISTLSSVPDRKDYISKNKTKSSKSKKKSGKGRK